MRPIGIYYAPGGPFTLYECSTIGTGWVTNLAYYDHVKEQMYSPSMVHIYENARDFSGWQRPEHWWGQFIKSSHSSFVLH